MTNNLNPVIPPPTMAIEIDRFIYEMQLLLSTRLAWLSNDYGRVYRFVEPAEGKLYIPSVYQGENRYLSMHPDKAKQGQCYFVANTEDVHYDASLLQYKVGIVFQVNLEEIDKPTTQNELFTQVLIAQAREVIQNFGLVNTSAKSIDIKRVDRDPREVYKEFTFSKESNNYNESPMQCFRINLEVELLPTCDFNFDFAQALINNISEAELLNILLPTIDFTKPNAISALTAQQITDLKAAIC